MISDFKGKTPEIHSSAYVSQAAQIIGYVSIGPDSSVWPGAVIRGDFGRIVIGSRTAIEDNCVLHTGDSLKIGDNVLIGHSATVHCRKIGTAWWNRRHPAAGF